MTKLLCRLSSFQANRVTTDLGSFKQVADVIVADRRVAELDDVVGKV